MATKKSTPNQRLWQKEVRRLKQFIRRAKKRGYIFPEDIIPDRPSRITKKQLSKIKALKPDVLYAKAEFVTPATGQTITGTEGRIFERKRAARKGVETKQRKAQINLPREVDTVLRHIEELIKEWHPLLNWSEYFTELKRNDRSTLQGMLLQSYGEIGRTETARRLQKSATDCIEMAERILYSSDEEQVNRDFVEFATIIKGQSLTVDESIELTTLAEFDDYE